MPCGWCEKMDSNHRNGVLLPPYAEAVPYHLAIFAYWYQNLESNQTLKVYETSMRIGASGIGCSSEI